MKWTVSLVALALIALWGALAYAAGVPDPGADPVAFASWFLSLFQGKNWPAVVGGLVILVVWLLRTKSAWLTGKVPWLTTRAGGWTLMGLLALLPVLAQGLIDHARWQDILRGILMAAGTAVLGWEAIKDKAKAKAPPKGLDVAGVFEELKHAPLPGRGV
jgi:hypothetical protein